MRNIKYGKIIKHISDSLAKKTNHLLKTEDLSITQSILIRLLNEESSKELPIKEIEKKFDVAQSTIYGVVSRLENKGIVSTYWKEHNVKIVKLTELGLSKVDFIEKNIIKVENELFTGFTEEEKATFTELLLRVEENIK